MGETLEEIQQPDSPAMAVQSDSEESTESTLGLGPGLSGMDLSGEAEGRGADPKTVGERLGAEGTDAQDCSEGEFSCRWGTCNEFFSHVDLLASHVTCVHATSSENGLFFCGWRGCSRGKRGFNARYKMLIHVRTHTNEKPHRCPRCDKSFSRAENLKIHARSHTGERPYVCPVPGCGKAYSNSSDRFKHTRTHSVERPYACRVPGCLKRYTDPSSLRKHVKTYAHYHRPGSDENTNTPAQDEKHKNKANGRDEVDIKSNSSDATPKTNHFGKNKNNDSEMDEVSQRNLRNSKSSSAKVLKIEKTLPSNPEVSPVPAEAVKKDNLAKRESGKTSNGLSSNEDIQECGRLQHLYIKNCSPAPWNSVPDDKWLENDIEEVEDDEDTSNQGDFQDQETLSVKERYYLSNEVIKGHMGHPALQRDSEWSSGAEEEWMSDESDYAQNGTLTIVDSLPNYLDFDSQVAKSNQKSYVNEKQFIPKLGKKNYILSKSCKQKLDDLLLRSYSKHGSSLYRGVKRNHFPLESFQPMDYSSSHIVHQSPVVDRYKKMMNEMAYHSISYEQVVPLDLRKVN